MLSCVVFMVACGGSGVDRDKQLVDLDDGEITELCEYSTDLAGPPRTIDCDGVMIRIDPNVANCVRNLNASQAMFPDCAATAGDFQRCAEAFAELSDEEFCTLDEAPPACQPLDGAGCK